MIMMEEFRRRKNLEKYWNEMNDLQRSEAINKKSEGDLPLDMDKSTLQNVHEYRGSNVERFFEAHGDDAFNPREFTLVFLDSDSVTNVTSLNRVNARRVLIFIGNGKGLVAYGKGKAEEYE